MTDQQKQQARQLVAEVNQGIEQLKIKLQAVSALLSQTEEVGNPPPDPNSPPPPPPLTPSRPSNSMFSALSSTAKRNIYELKTKVYPIVKRKFDGNNPGFIKNNIDRADMFNNIMNVVIQEQEVKEFYGMDATRLRNDLVQILTKFIEYVKANRVYPPDF
jgi:hypothetical protein